jgi:threonine aldolase
MVFFSLDPDKSRALTAHCRSNGILISGQGEFRLVTHLDVTTRDIHRVIQTFETFFDET